MDASLENTMYAAVIMKVIDLASEIPHPKFVLLICSTVGVYVVIMIIC